LNLRSIPVSAILFSVFGFVGTAGATDFPDDGGATAIIDKYVEATHLQPVEHAMEVNINASVPQLKKHATLRALRKISNVGKITYRVLGFQGDNSVKKEVISRYLQAEQQSQGDPTVMLTPANYKFKLKGRRRIEAGATAYIFQVAPRKKRMGLFKGELWLDANSFLPVLEKGRLVKSPSIFFKKVDFERAFSINNGISVPAHMTSTIDTRIVGKVELDVRYTAVAEETDEAGGAIDTASLTSFTIP